MPEDKRLAAIMFTDILGIHPYANHYLVNGTTFPDVIIANSNVIKEGIGGIEGAGFIGNDSSIEKGNFVWRK